MHFIALDRPLAVFDIESTGLNPRTDRIIELSVVKLQPGPARARETKTWLFNPGIPIPVETTAIHGITDEMVASAPSFADKAAEVLEFFKGCDLGGFGLSKLDIPILEEEFARCGLRFGAFGRRMFDALRIYHKREPRDLAAALRFFCGEDPVDSHGAEADAVSALRVLEGEFAKYPDLPTSPDELDAYLNERDPALLDREGRFRKGEGDEIIINFGRKKGTKLSEIARAEPSWLLWMIHGDFPHDAKSIAREALAKWGPKKQDKHPNGGGAAAKPRENKGGEAARHDGARHDGARHEHGHHPPRQPETPPKFATLAASFDAIFGTAASGNERQEHRQ